MFGVGLPEMAVIAFVAVLVLGPDRLPEIARQAGVLVRKGRALATSARDELREELGPEFSDLELRDLDPREIVRRHVIEAMEEPAVPARPATLAAGERPPYDDEAT